MAEAPRRPDEPDATLPLEGGAPARPADQTVELPPSVPDQTLDIRSAPPASAPDQTLDIRGSAPPANVPAQTLDFGPPQTGRPGMEPTLGAGPVEEFDFSVMAGA